VQRGHSSFVDHGTERRSHSRVLDFGSLKIDLDAYEVEVNGRAVPVYLREFQILALLSQTPRKVWSREEIVRAVWGKDAAVDVRTVDVHIRRLRLHLGGSRSAAGAVVTVRGVGYKFDPRRLPGATATA